MTYKYNFKYGDRLKLVGKQERSPSETISMQQYMESQKDSKFYFQQYDTWASGVNIIIAKIVYPNGVSEDGHFYELDFEPEFVSDGLENWI